MGQKFLGMRAEKSFNLPLLFTIFIYPSPPCNFSLIRPPSHTVGTHIQLVELSKVSICPVGPLLAVAVTITAIPAGMDSPGGISNGIEAV